MGNPAKNIWVRVLRSTFPKTHMEPQQFNLVQMILDIQVFFASFVCSKSYVDLWRSFFSIGVLGRCWINWYVRDFNRCGVKQQLNPHHWSCPGKHPLSRLVWFIHNYLDIHPGRLTWNLQITHLERKMIFQTSMFMVHVNLPGCNDFEKNAFSSKHITTSQNSPLRAPGRTMRAALG